MLEQADDMLRLEHKWLLDHEGLIVALVGNKYPAGDRRQKAQKVYRHLHAWGLEFAWFTQENTGLLQFPDICGAIGADVDVAREKRRRYFALPFSPMIVHNVMRGHGAREIRRGRPQK